MKLLGALQHAVKGWMLLLRGEAGWRQYFRLTNAGLVTALALFYLFAFLAVLVASFDIGVPTLGGFLTILFAQSLWLVALLAGIFATRAFLRDRTVILPLLIPGIYALIAYLALGTVLTFTLGILLPLLWLALAFMLFRLARAATAWSMGVAGAFGVLTVVLLVGLPMTLYMLLASPPA